MAIETYESKSGVEIQAVFKDTKFGDLHMIKYVTQRDVANVHVMGSVDAVSVARGKRATSGACVFAVFDKDRLIESMKNSADSQVFLSNSELANYSDSGAPTYNTSKGAVRTDGAVQSVFNKYNFGKFTAPRLLDQIPPFDITLVGVSEASGNASRMVIHGVQFSSDQGGSSVDDLLLERQVTFIARRITPWQNLDELVAGSGASLATSNSVNGIQATGSFTQ